jgi:uncharacterized protein
MWLSLHTDAQARQRIAIQEPLAIETSGRLHCFSVAIANTNVDRVLGLMNRHELDADEGMLFIHEDEQEVSFWMKNTYIPLDLLFVGADGTIKRIAMNAMPHSLDDIPSTVPVLAVLEVKAGTVLSLGIKAGDRIHHDAFGNAL